MGGIMIEVLKELVREKRVLILGFGREGKSTYHMLQIVGGYESLTIADKNAITDSVEATLLTGDAYQQTLNDYDIVFKSPGIVLEQEYESYTCHILSQTEVFFRRYREQIVGITGTKGKSTTTTLLYHILKEAGKDVVLAGNIGIPAFDIVKDITPDSIIVFEMSCHQLEYMTTSPRIGILLNIHEEHLDHYGTMEKYVAAKENVYRHQQSGDILFCNKQCLPAKGTCAGNVVEISCEAGSDIRLKGEQIECDEVTYDIPVYDIGLIGHHNYFDIAFVYGVAKEYGITDEAFTSGLCTYETLPHRLQFVGIYGGVRFYDDSISTICDTAIQALESVPGVETILLGGMDRGIDYTELIDYLNESPVPNIILMEDTGKRILKEINARPHFRDTSRLFLVEHLEDAVKKAKEVTRPGKSCVLSPAAASYGIFKNFEERGERFQEFVRVME